MEHGPVKFCLIAPAHVGMTFGPYDTWEEAEADRLKDLKQGLHSRVSTIGVPGRPGELLELGVPYVAA